MGPNSEGRIAPYVVGCQPIADVTGADGRKILDFVMPATANGRSGLALNPVHPHTVRGRGEVRVCAECHRSPPSLGLGSGNYNIARNRAFVAAADGVRVYDRKTNPKQPVLQGMLPVAGATAVAIQPNIIEGTADILYVAAGAAGVLVYDLRGVPSGPTATLALRAIDVRLAGQHLDVVEEGVGVGIFDINTPSLPNRLATVPIPTARRAIPWGIHLFVAAGRAGLVVVEVASHVVPVISGSLAGLNAADLWLYAHYQLGLSFAARAYVVDPDYGVRVVDLLPRFARPRLVGGLELPGATATTTFTSPLDPPACMSMTSHNPTQ